MNRTITSEIIVASSLCQHKAFLLLCTQERGTLHEYEQILQQRKHATQNQVLQSLPTNPNSCFSTLAALRSAGDVVASATLLADGFEAVCGMVAKVRHPSSPSECSYEPAIFVGTYSITKEQKLELLFAGYVLGKIQGKLPEQGKLIGADGVPHRVKFGKESTDLLLPLLHPLQQWAIASSSQPPPLILNKHCPSCQFRDLCKARAEKEDNLSLLSSIKAKDIHHYAKKGIFTVKQLSYVYKPRRPSKRAKNIQATHKPEFQALAIRMGKVYLHHIPTFSRQPVELFFDMEGIPDQQCYYLIGLLISEDNTCSYHAFWAG